MTKIHNELRKEFQLERMILFTDAVFAIAITLLIIEIKAPDIQHLAKELGHQPTRVDKINQLLQLLGKFIGFIVSFIIVGIYWVAHHRIFGYVKNYDNKLLWLNLFFLFTIVLMPFSSAYYSENYGEKIPFAFYCFNVIATGLANFFLANYLTKNHKTLTEGFSNLKLQKLMKLRILVVPAAFFTSFLVVLFASVWFASYVPMLIIPIMKLLTKKYGKERDLEDEGHLA